MLPEGWEWKRLEDVAQIEMGQCPPGNSYNKNGEGIPLINGPTEFGTISPITVQWTDKPTKICQPRDILYCVRGATTGKMNIADKKYCIGRGVASLTVKTIDDHYLFHYLKMIRPQIERMGVGSAIKGISSSIICSILIPVPPPEIQHSIASILDKAEMTKRLRAQAKELTQNLLQSAFLEMFGDPFNNPKNWPVVKIKDVITATQYGTSERSSGNPRGYPILGMNNILNNGDLDLSHTNFIEMNDENFDKYRLEPDDLLFNRTNAAIHVGKTGLFSEGSNYVFASYLVRITVKREKMVPAFLWAYLNSRFMRKKFTGMCKKAVNQANINATELGNLPIYLPPIHLQEQFSQAIRKLTVLKGLEIKSMETEESLYNALIAKAFTGELVA